MARDGRAGTACPGCVPGPRATHGAHPAYSGAVFVPALVPIAVGVGVGVVGVLAACHRLPRNRVIGVGTRWTMSRVDTFRRANRAAAPAFLAAGGVGVVGGVGSVCSSGAAAVTLLVAGLVGLLVLLGAAGAIGVRYATADEATEIAAHAAGPSGPCILEKEEPECTADGACAGSCALCPRPGATDPAHG